LLIERKIFPFDLMINLDSFSMHVQIELGPLEIFKKKIMRMIYIEVEEPP